MKDISIRDCQEIRQQHPLAKGRIDEVPLFGSRFLRRNGDTNMWILTSGTAQPVHLTKRESMFINAALHAAKAETPA